MQIDSRDLRYFETIAELGHLRQASDELHRSQPALSKCIKRLEQAVGAPLFERVGRNIQLSAVGEALLQQARKLNRMTESALREVQEFASGEAGLVRIGCGPVMAESLMPGICELITRQMPGVRLTITMGMNYYLRDELRQGNIDVIFGLVPDADTEFRMHALMDDTVVVAASRAHPLFAKRKLKIEDLVDAQWVLPIPAVASRLWLDQQFRERNLPLPTAQIEVNTIPMLLTMIAKSNLLCFVSRHTLAKQTNTPRLEELRLDTLTMQRKLGVTLMHSSLSPAVQRFVELLQTHATTLADAG